MPLRTEAAQQSGWKRFQIFKNNMFSNGSKLSEKCLMITLHFISVQNEQQVVKTDIFTLSIFLLTSFCSWLRQNFLPQSKPFGTWLSCTPGGRSVWGQRGGRWLCHTERANKRRFHFYIQYFLFWQKYTLRKFTQPGCYIKISVSAIAAAYCELFKRLTAGIFVTLSSLTEERSPAP